MYLVVSMRRSLRRALRIPLLLLEGSAFLKVVLCGPRDKPNYTVMWIRMKAETVLLAPGVHIGCLYGRLQPGAFSLLLLVSLIRVSKHISLSNESQPKATNKPTSLELNSRIAVYET